MVVLGRHHEFLPVDVKPELEHRAALVYLQSSRRGRGGHTVRNGVFFHKAGESTKTHPHPLHAIYALQRTAPCVTAPASTAAFPPAMQVPRRTPRSLSLPLKLSVKEKVLMQI